MNLRLAVQPDVFFETKIAFNVACPEFRKGSMMGLCKPSLTRL